MTDYRVEALRFPSFYVSDLSAAKVFYTQVLGPPQCEEEQLAGWKIGDTWLTLFPAVGAAPIAGEGPRNSEIAIRVSETGGVDAMLAALVRAGATLRMPARDTEMYESMRFGCVDDPFGIRVDVYCPLT